MRFGVNLRKDAIGTPPGLFVPTNVPGGAQTLERNVGLAVMAGILVFIVWPILAVLLESLQAEGAFDLAAYAYLFTNSRLLIGNTLLVACLTTVLSVGMGLVIALFMTRSGNRGRRIVFGALLLTMISPPFVTSLSYIMLFGRRGLITNGLLGLSLNPYGWQGIALMESAGLTSLAALIIAGSLHGTNRSLEHAARDLGAGNAATLFQVIIPMARPGMLAAAMLVFIKSLSDFGTPLIIGGGFNVLASEAYMTAIGIYDLPRASAMNALLLVFSFGAFLVCRKSLSQGLLAVEGNKGGLGWPAPPSPRAIDRTLAMLTWLFVGFQILQYGCILSGAFCAAWGSDFSLTLKHIRALDAYKISSFARSLCYAALAGVVSAALGMIMSYLVTRKRVFSPRLLDFASALPLIIPGVFFGLGYVLAFNFLPRPILDSGALIVCNFIFRQLPVGVRAGEAVLAGVGEDIERAARDLGAKQWRVFANIVMPLLRPAFLASFVNAFTAAMTAIGSIIFLATPGTKLATVELFEVIKAGDIGLGAVLANMIVAVTLSVNIIFSLLLLRRKKRAQDSGDAPCF